MQVALAYEGRTQLVNEWNGSALEFAANTRRAPVAFQGNVRDPILMRELMIAMHEAILSDANSDIGIWLLDPVITVHPDELFFEAFSNDSAAYVRLSARTEAFDSFAEPTYGTTNIDFTFALRQAFMNLRKSRQTTFTIGAGGFAVETTDAIRRGQHFERKVVLPDHWVRGFLQVQSALAMKPFTFHVRPVDLLNVISFFIENRVRKPPHGLRYVFKPDEPIQAILEPWEQAFTFQDALYTGYERTVRVWGRKRLELLRRVLPYADRVTIGVLGRGLPHFYSCHCGPYTFTLVLSGWAENDFAAGGALDLLAPQTALDPETVAKVYNVLAQRLALTRNEVEAHTLLPGDQVEAALFKLCRAGRVMYDPNARRYRSRELFAEPIDFDSALASDPRLKRAQQLVKDEAVIVHHVAPSDVKPRERRALATVTVEGIAYEVLVAVDEDDRIRFGQCKCDFFRTNILHKGPCEHMLATRFAAAEALAQLPAVEKSAIL